jgi:hypothetical protein
MRTSLRIIGSVVSVAGLVQEGLNARNSDPYSLSLQSVILTFLFAILLFVSNLRPFNTIGLNVGKFDFDQHCFAGSMYLIKDRSRAIIKSLKLRDIPPPK